MHCFSGSRELAEAVLEIGFYISFAGTVTFKKASDLRDLAARVPLNRLLIETDCPYLSPEPFRGRRNEPARVVEVARLLAGLHNCEVEKLASATSSNFSNLFRCD
jgi:TatD DNase family protein